VAAVVAATVVVFVPAAQGRERITCSSGATVVLDGRLRILGIPVPQPGRRDKVGLYACLRGGRPTAGEPVACLNCSALIEVPAVGDSVRLRV